jgi:hypothetical protein
MTTPEPVRPAEGIVSVLRENIAAAVWCAAADEREMCLEFGLHINAQGRLLLHVSNKATNEENDFDLAIPGATVAKGITTVVEIVNDDQLSLSDGKSILKMSLAPAAGGCAIDLSGLPSNLTFKRSSCRYK